MNSPVDSSFLNIQTVYQSSRTHVFRAIDQESSRPLLIKQSESLSSDYEQLGQCNEWIISQELDPGFIVKPIKILHQNNQPTLVYPDDDLEPLSNTINKEGLAGNELVNIAIAITQSLDSIHQSGVLHRDINPSNIVISQDKQTIRLIDFEYATKLTEQSLDFTATSELKGTLDYISPEQTGRINRAVDFRTDLYSLGATLFQLATGKALYEYSDPARLIYAHIAELPRKAVDLNPAIGTAFSDIIDRLLRKNPEDRYQSCKSLLSDLHHLHQAFIEKSDLSNFKAGEQEEKQKLQLAEGIFGREEEKSYLFEIFRSVTSSSSLLCIQGASGVGKSVLIRELFRVISEQNGFYLTGKFDQLSKGQPYTAISSALNQFVTQAVADCSISWKEIIQKTIGDNGPLLCGFVPKFEVLIGKQDAVPVMSAKETATRRNQLFEDLFVDICGHMQGNDRSVVLFIDDLQWSGVGSIEVLERIANKVSAGLMLILSYRDEEIKGNSVAFDFTNKMLNTDNAHAKSLTLTALSTEKIKEWMNFQFGLDNDESESLADQLYLRSQGNPFHIRSLLGDIIQKQIIHFDKGNVKIDWKALSALPMVAADEHIENIIRQLPKDQCEFIKRISILGNSFSITMIEKLLGEEAVEFESVVKALINQGLLLKADLKLFFSHDKIQHAAANILGVDEANSLHLSLAELLFLELKDKSDWKSISECLHFYNCASDLINSSERKLEVAQLNADLAKHLISQAANNEAERILYEAKKLLPRTQQGITYSKLAAEIHVALGQILTGGGRQKAGEKYLDWAINSATNEDEKTDAYLAKLVFLSAEQRTDDAEVILMRLLSSIDVKFPTKITKWHQLKSYLSCMLTPRVRSPEEILSMPEMTDEALLKKMRILSSCMLATYFSAADYFLLILTQMVKLTLQHGRSRYSSAAISGFAVVNIAFKNYSLAKRYGDLSLTLLDQYDNKSAAFVVYLAYGGLIHHWFSPLHECEEYGRKAMKVAAEMGDFESANLASTFILALNYLNGLNLNSLLQKYKSHVDYISKHNDKVFAIHNGIAQQYYHTLSDPNSDGISVVGKYFDEKELENIKVSQGESQFVSAYFSDKGYLYLLLRDFEKAFKFELKGVYGSMSKSIGSLYLGTLYYYGAYAALECIFIKHRTKEAKALYKHCLKHVTEYAKQCPINYRGKLLILRAKQSENAQDISKTIKLYDEASKFISINDPIQDLAFLKEQYGRFLLKNGIEDLARLQLVAAYDEFERWGAQPKLARLEKEFGFLKRTENLNSQNTSAGSVTSNLNTSLDLQSLSSSIEILSASLNENELISGLMLSLLQNSGASLVVYLQPGDNTVSVRAIQHGQGNCKHYHDEQSRLSNFNLCNDLIADVYKSNSNEKLTNIIREDGEVSILILPVERQGRLAGLIYLENKYIKDAFRNEQLRILRLLAGQAAIALENAKAFKDLSAERQSSDTIINSLPMMVFSIAEDTTILFANPEASTISGYKNSELIGSQWGEILQIKHESLSKRCSNTTSFESMTSHELPIKTKNREERIILWTSVVKPGNDKKGRTLLFGMDATEEIIAKRKILNFNQKLQAKVEERTQELQDSLIDLKETQDKLIESEKSAALNGLVAGVAHEINTPIGIGVTGITQFLQATSEIVTDYKSGSMNQAQLEGYFEKSSQIAQLTHSNLERAADLVKSFKQISVDNANEAKRSFLIKDYVSQLANGIQIQHSPRKIALDLGKSDDFEIDSYPGLIAQIFNNLISNSVIHGFEQNDSCSIAVEIYRDDGTLFIDYRDTGKGIPVENLKKIFDPFFTTNNFGGGTGLGLSVVHNIVVQNLRGEIECSSTLGSGTQFLLRLPLDPH